MNLHHLSIVELVLVFAIAATSVWFAGTRLAIYGDELSERLKISKAFIGLIFLATVTELPEIVTTITAAQVGNSALVLGNMFGGITMQTAILAVADFFVVRNALTSWPRKPTHALLAVLLIVLLAMLLVITFLGDFALALNVGLGAILLSGAYPVVIAMLRRYDEKESWAPIDLPDESQQEVGFLSHDNHLEETPTRSLLLFSALTALTILVAGVALAMTADSIAEKTSLGSSFIGISLLAAATSLPELSTTFAAARMGAYTMALSNVFGSNLIMLALILPADMAYRNGPILAEVEPSAQFSLATGIVVTAIYVAGLLIRRTPSLLGAGLDSWLVMTVYLGMLISMFYCNYSATLFLLPLGATI
ncbi:MAG: sodium:calcium antiporter [Rhizobiaceae bacterium]|nr:sodium:calcium antiporter [Rhizobiaceae bacterium]